MLFCTMYREKDGTVQEKEATVVIKQKLPNGEAEFGRVDINLAQYSGINNSYEITTGFKNATIKLFIHSKHVKEADNEDAISNISDLDNLDSSKRDIANMNDLKDFDDQITVANAVVNTSKSSSAGISSNPAVSSSTSSSLVLSDDNLKQTDKSGDSSKVLAVTQKNLGIVNTKLAIANSKISSLEKDLESKTAELLKLKESSNLVLISCIFFVIFQKEVVVNSAQKDDSKNDLVVKELQDKIVGLEFQLKEKSSKSDVNKQLFLLESDVSFYYYLF